jgi:translation initiation factor 1
MSPNESRTVWSSEEGDLRKKKKENSPPAVSPPQHQQTAYLHRDSKGRAGKGVILIKNLHLSEENLSALAKRIKQGCGVGGTVKDGMIEIQGGNRERVAEVLVKLGYKVKMAGG